MMKSTFIIFMTFFLNINKRLNTMPTRMVAKIF